MITFLTIWKLVALSTFWCVGIYMNRDEGDIFHFLIRLTREAPAWIKKPVIGCINCMASLHSLVVTGIYAMLIGLPVVFWYEYFLLWLIVAIITCGINGIVWVVYQFFKQYAEVLEMQNFEQETKVD